MRLGACCRALTNGRGGNVASDPEADDYPIEGLNERLKLHRANLQNYLRQQALQGEANVSPIVIHGIAEARRAIAQIKADLRRLGAEAADMPDDAAAPAGAPAPPADPLERYDLRRRARRAYFAGNLAEAIPLLEQICLLEPDNAEYQTWLAQARRQYDEQERLEDIRYLLSEGNWQAALRAIADLERSYPPTPALDDLRRQAEGLRRSAIVRPAHELVARAQYGAAVAWLAQRLQLQPDDRDSAAYLAGLIEAPDVPLAHRVRAAEIVGKAGDPRIPVDPGGWRHTLRPLLGAGYWCAVSAGADASRPQVSGTIWLARYPLTNSQYQAFVRAGGYREPRWWQPEGWAWRERRFAMTEPIAIGPIGSGPPNHPLVGLNWFEALAFCAWLSDQVGDLIPPGHELRPPTEPEWEAAAFADHEGRPRRYPWGDGPPSPDHAVYRTDTTNGPLAVGCCPAGRAACGALDLLGNIYELLVPPEPDDPAQDEPQIPWRGGSWGSAAEDLDQRITMRRVTRHMHYGGLRLAIGPALRLP